jgi:hypothetical protein
MDFLAVSAGVLIACSGVVLSWYQKSGAGIWATYVFGFLLVLIGSPLRANLSALSVSGKGLQVSFRAVEASPEQLTAIENRARSAIVSLTADKANQVNGETRQLVDKASQGVVEQLLPFIRSLGFVPTQIVSAIQLSPGTIVSLKDGRIVTVATPSQAFPKLETLGSSIPFPMFQIERSLPRSMNGKVLVKFECKNGAEVIEASIVALESTMDQKLTSHLAPLDEYFVVQAVLRCSEPIIASSTRMEKTAEAGQQDFKYTGKETILGYKLLALKGQSNTVPMN